MVKPFAVCLFGILLVSTAFGQTDGFRKPTPVSGSGSSVLDEHVGGNSIRVVVSTNKVEIGSPTQERPQSQTQRTNCTYSRFPCSQVVNLSIWVNGARLFVHRSVIADLTDVGTMEMSSVGATYVLTLVGGDASESYTAKIYFDARRIGKRELYANEANSLVETTTYFAPAVLD